MTELLFRYSDIYDYSLSQLAGQPFNWEKVEESYAYVKEYQAYWSILNDKIFTYYESFGLVLPEFWMGYFVHAKPGLIPFSDPLTLIINPNREEVTATLIHELCHVFLTYYKNQEVYTRLISSVNQKHSKEEWSTRIHLIVNILATYGLNQVFDQEKVETLLSLEKKYPGLQKAWKILDANPGVFTEKSPLEAILHVL